MNKRLVVTVETEKVDAQGVNQSYSFTFPYGAQANDIFAVLNEIGTDLDLYVKEIVAQQEAQKAKDAEEAAKPIDVVAEPIAESAS
jgi:hypothetical protein